MITFPQPRSSVLGNPWCHLSRERAKTTGLEWQSGRLFQKCVQFLKLGLTAEFSRLVWISGSVGFKKWNPRVLICWKAGVAVDSIFRRLFNQFVEGNCWIPSQKNVKCIFSQHSYLSEGHWKCKRHYFIIRYKKGLRFNSDVSCSCFLTDWLFGLAGVYSLLPNVSLCCSGFTIDGVSF